jgi:antirestriction protein ArdC
MNENRTEQNPASRPGLYQEITDKITRQIEAGTIPWVQPWAADQAPTIPRNAATDRAYNCDRARRHKRSNRRNLCQPYS